MKNVIKNNIFLIVVLVCLFGASLFDAYQLSLSVPLSQGYLDEYPIANFDGKYYLSIARSNYFPGDQAFFPLFPITIHLLGDPTSKGTHYGGVTATIVAFVSLLLLIPWLGSLDGMSKNIPWIIAWMLFFPTSFFFGAIYTEAFFLCLLFASFISARKKNFLFASLFAGLASATKVVGIFVLPSLLIEIWIMRKELTKAEIIRNVCFVLFLSPLGLISYMIFLWKRFNDPFAFLHALAAYGAHRSLAHITLLPQVTYRYIKIFFTPILSTHDFWISRLEFVMFFFVLGILLYFWKRIRPSYLFFSLASLILPTLTGSFSSIPRYVLVCFPIFYILSSIRPRIIQVGLLVASGAFMIVLAMFFYRGYFIA